MEPFQVCVSGVCGPSPCPYCRSPTGMVYILPTYWPDGMDCWICERLVDRGWFRAGRQCYLPLHDQLCCVSYQFRVDALAFQPSKAQSRVLRNMHRFLEGEKELKQNGKLQACAQEAVALGKAGSRPPRVGPDLPAQLTNLVWTALEHLHKTQVLPLPNREATQVAVTRRKSLKSQGVAYHCAVCLGLGHRASSDPTMAQTLASTYAAALVRALMAVKGMWPASVTRIFESSGYINFCCSTPQRQQRGGFAESCSSRSIPNGEHVACAAAEGGQGIYAASSSQPPPMYAPPLTMPPASEASWSSYSAPPSSVGPGDARPCSSPDTPPARRRHALEISMLRPTVDTETYRLFKKYQRTVHQEMNWTYSRFQTEFVDSCLPQADPHYGTFHVQYRLDNQLIMVGIVDILPHCLCSCYLFYDTDYKALALGKYSVLWELNWLRQKSGTEPYPTLRYYYLGSYVHNCHKVNYKAEYGPAELLCPITLQWVELRMAQKVLDRQLDIVTCTRLADLGHWPGRPESPLEHCAQMSREELDQLSVVFDQCIQPLGIVRSHISQASTPYNKQRLNDVVQVAHALGRELLPYVAFAARFELSVDDPFAGFDEDSAGPKPSPPTNSQPPPSSDDETAPDPDGASTDSSGCTECSSASSAHSGADRPADLAHKEPPTPKKAKIRHKGGGDA